MSEKRPYSSFCQDNRHKLYNRNGAVGPLPISLTVYQAEMAGGPCHGAVGWGPGPLPGELLAMVGGYFYTATRTLPPRSRPLLGGLCLPPTPVIRFSGVWWRAEWPWRPSGSWRTGEASQVWVGAWVGLLKPTGPARGYWFQNWLPSLDGQCGRSGCLGS